MLTGTCRAEARCCEAPCSAQNSPRDHSTGPPAPHRGPARHSAASRSAARCPAARPRAANPPSGEDLGRDALRTACPWPEPQSLTPQPSPSRGVAYFSRPGASFPSETPSSSTRNYPESFRDEGYLSRDTRQQNGESSLGTQTIREASGGGRDSDRKSSAFTIVLEKKGNALESGRRP